MYSFSASVTKSWRNGSSNARTMNRNGNIKFNISFRIVRISRDDTCVLVLSPVAPIGNLGTSRDSTFRTEKKFTFFFQQYVRTRRRRRKTTFSFYQKIPTFLSPAENK